MGKREGEGERESDNGSRVLASNAEQPERVRRCRDGDPTKSN